MSETEAKRIFLEAFEMPRGEREGFVEAHCAGDEALRRRVRQLLAAHDESSVDELFDGSPQSGAGGDGWDALDGPAPPQSVGPYRVLGVLGEGGMGMVYEAQQEHPHRLVALKVVRPGVASRRSLARFEMETEILGRLAHPGIARIYDAGTTNEGAGPQPYFAMELVRGKPLIEHATSGGEGGAALDLRQRMRLMVRICEAVDYAHRSGIVHRDLKPANILVDEEGQPKILDFGVARLTETSGEGSAAPQTMTGELVGTVSYMSPEQVAGKPGALDHRSDVYALGLIAYQLVTGELPYALAGLSVFAAVETIREHEPRRARERSREVDPDLDTILLKALEKEPSRRYASAQALGEDIQRWLNHETILARPATRWYRFRKFSRRNPFLVGGVAAVLAVTTLGAVGTTIGMLRAQDKLRLSRSATDYWLTALDRLGRGEGGKATTFEEVLAEAAPNIEAGFADWPDEQARMHRVHGEMFRIVAQHDKALEQFEKALAALEQTPHAPTRAQFEALMGAATAALELQDMARAEMYFARAERVLPGSGGAEYTEHLAGRAATAHDRGDYELAEHLLRAGLAAQEGAVFERESDRLRARAIDTGNLARLLVDRGRIDDGLALAREAIRLWQEAGEGRTRGWAFAMLTLGYAHHGAGRWEDAEAAYRSAVETYEGLDAGRGPMVAIARMDLAGLMQDTADARATGAAGGVPAAPPTWDRADLGDLAHVEVISLRNRARILWRADRRDEAATLFAEAVTRAREIGGSAATVWVSHTLLARGLAAGESGEWQTALAPLRAAVEESPESVPARAALGRALAHTGAPAQAEPLLRSVLATRLQTVGDAAARGPLPTAAARIDLAACLAALERHKEATGLVAGLEERIPGDRADLLERLNAVSPALGARSTNQ